MAVRKPVAKPKKPKTNRQRLQAQIHIAQKELKLDDATYRSILGQYGPPSTRTMSESQMKKVIAHFKDIGWKPKRPKEKTGNHGWGQNKYENFRGREGVKASPQELRTIEGLWARVSRAKNKDAALRTFLNRRWKIGDITWIDRDQSLKIINVLKEMYWRHIMKQALHEWTEQQIKRATRFFLEPESDIRTAMYPIFGGHDASEILANKDEYWIHAMRVMYRLEKYQ